VSHAVADAVALAMLAAARRDAKDLASRMALADRLAELGPASPVNPERMPPWLRIAWQRTYRSTTGHPGARNNWEILNEIRQAVGDRWSVIDHHGSAVVLGLECFVSEPYGEVSHLRDAFSEIARAMRTVDAWVLDSAHNPPHTSRLILFPPEHLPPRRQKKITWRGNQ